MEYWRQCTLQKGNTTTTAWIPEWAAKVNNVVKSSEDNILNGYTVVVVGEQRITDEVAKNMDRMHKRFKEGGSLARM